MVPVLAAGRQKAGPPVCATGTSRKDEHLLHVLEERLAHLEHRRLAANDLAQRGVRGDGALGVQLLRLDVAPDRLDDPRVRHFGFARDGGQRGAARANLEDALARSLLLRRNLLASRDRSLALVLALLALAAREANLLLLFLGLLLLFLLRLLRLLGLLRLPRLLRGLLLRLLRAHLLRASESGLRDLLGHLGNDDRKLRLHVCVENKRRCPFAYESPM